LEDLTQPPHNQLLPEDILALLQKEALAPEDLATLSKTLT
jgi:hypothetical protein